MISKCDYVESQLISYYYHKTEIKKIDEEIEKIEHEMTGLKSPRFDSVPVNAGEDRQHKLIRLGEKLSVYESRKSEYKASCIVIANELNLDSLDDTEKALIKYLYLYKYTYDKIARIIGYTDKSYVFRKKENILNKLSLNTRYL